jgi:hypothetical protein
MRGIEDRRGGEGERGIPAKTERLYLACSILIPLNYIPLQRDINLNYVLIQVFIYFFCTISASNRL